ncbi:SGNH/GDSL hydrolase family protein [Streptomyces reniochalinae]|uniref:SGNH/GDSL hydrolase family protein n=1 Tax=Streptomyces reniochalinae TaxID=2250578 RepID=A0A367E9S2_9ACTN|nr:SGNH/GDSL hydrolase family protein [Streptomyces reniochalinae]RCG14788.1 SGNH/GDSL hydrolase family protein [Streptomyces reniochalinae]
MPDSHEAANTRPSRSRIPRPRRSRTAAICAFVLVAVAGLVLAVACGGTPDGGDRDGAQRADGSTRPPAKPSPRRVWDRSPASLAAVGDSITRGFDACSLLADCTRVSWATGTAHDVDSLARRLLSDPKGKSWNYAVSGAVVADLPQQMRKAAAKEPDMVTVMSGANDACRPTVEQMTGVADFRADFRESLRALRSASPSTQVYVSSVPDLKRLWQQGRTNPIGQRVWGLGICQSMLRDPQSMDAADKQRRQQVHDRVVAYNTVLEQECAKDLRCRYDNGAVFDYRFTPAELSSWDWFHPSKEGQRSLAELAYEEITERRPTG